MDNTRAIIRFCSVALSIVIFLAYGSYKSLFVVDSAVESDQSFNQNTTSVQSDATVLESEDEEKAQSSSAASQQTASNKKDTASVAVSATGVVKGDIIDRFISPYTANTSYNNVYLKNNTELQIDLKEFVDSELDFKIEKNAKPQVLILHTHATESYIMHNENYYTDTDRARNTNNKKNMVALGKIISERLNGAGIVTLHDTTQHDYPSYNESYSRAAQTICNYQEKYKSIKIVIDLHRDALAASNGNKIKTTTEINGKRAAQIMLVMGSQSGGVTNFPNWKENLKLASKLQQTLEVMYPSLARSIHFMPKNYNQSLSTGSLLIEIGTDGNNFDEAKYSAELLSDALICLLNTI